MNIQMVVAVAVALGLANGAFAQSGARNNLVKPIHGPGPVSPGSRAENTYVPPPSVVIVTPCPVPVQTVIITIQPEVVRYQQPAYSARYLSNRSPSRVVGAYAVPSTHVRPVCTTAAANWGLSTSSIMTDPWWRGDGFSTRSDWRGVGSAYSNGTAWWTTGVDEAFGLSVPEAGRFTEGYVVEPEIPGRIEHRYAPARRYIIIDDQRDERVVIPAAGVVEVEAEWHEPDAPSATAAIAPRPRRDIRPDVRRAARLTAERQYIDAIDTVRRAVVEEPEAFTGRHGNLLGKDKDSEQRLRSALLAFQSPPGRVISATDAKFMAAAIHAVLGEHESALASIRVGRELGEDRPSGRALYRVLSRTDSAEAKP